MVGHCCAWLQEGKATNLGDRDLNSILVLLLAATPLKLVWTARLRRGSINIYIMFLHIMNYSFDQLSFSAISLWFPPFHLSVMAIIQGWGSTCIVILPSGWNKLKRDTVYFALLYMCYTRIVIIRISSYMMVIFEGILVPRNFNILVCVIPELWESESELDTCLTILIFILI